MLGNPGKHIDKYRDFGPYHILRKEDTVMTVMRNLRRSVAHHRMELAGYNRVNKKGHSNDKAVPSFFSQNWYDYLVKTKQPGEFASKKNKRHGHKAA